MEWMCAAAFPYPLRLGERAKQRRSFRGRARRVGAEEHISKPRRIPALTAMALDAVGQLWHSTPYARHPPLLRAADRGGWRHSRDEDLARARGRAALDA